MPTPFESAAWQILRHTYLRLLCLPEGRDARRLTVEEANLMLDPHLKMLQHDFRMLKEIMSTAQASGIQHVHGLLHNREGVDNEMLDQTVEYATLDMAAKADK